MSIKIGIGGDHAGFELKNILVKELSQRGHIVKDFGPETYASCDYEDYVHPLASSIEKGETDYGIIICGSANGVNMTANKHKGIRSGLAWAPEVAQLIRQHNDANIVAIPARFVSIEEARDIVDVFLSTEFEGGRHQRRINKIPC